MTFVRDPCGIACLVVTYGAVGYADYVVIRWIILQTMPASVWAPLHAVVFNTVVFLLSMAHMKAVLSDPGTVPLSINRLDFSDLQSAQQRNGGGSAGSAGNGSGVHDHGEWTICTRCETYRPPRAHHCRICKRCIRRMDHHCPWINNCVGERNQKFFLQFLVYVGILSIYSVALVLGSWIYPCEECNANVLESQTRILHSVILLLESTLFGLFVVAIMVDQLYAILHDETAVEAVQQKGTFRPNRRKLNLLGDVFGRGHPACWLMPCTNFHTTRRYETPLLNHEV